MMSDVDSRNV